MKKTLSILLSASPTMKALCLIVVFLFFNFFSYSQTFRPDEGTVSTSPTQPAQLVDTIVVSSLSKIQIYSNALRFITSSFKDSRNVIEMKDSDLGEILFKGNISKAHNKELEGKKGKKTLYRDDITLHFKCGVYIKDNKYKVVVSSLEYDLSSIIKMNLSLSYPKENTQTSERNDIAVDMAVNLIKEISYALNKKPENDF